MNKRIRRALFLLRQRISPQLLTFFLILIIGGITLFIRPIIGVADNGDYFRIMSSNDLYHLPVEEEDKILGYFNKDYGIYEYHNESETLLISTQSFFIKLALGINKIFYSNKIFDIRFLGGLLLFIHSIAGYLLVKVFTSYLKKERLKYLISLLYVVIFCDTGYISYFNSFYGEGVVVPTFLLSVGIILYIIRFNKINLLNIILFSCISLLFFGAKQQLAPIGILIAILILKVAFSTKDKIIRTGSIVLSIIFVVSAVFFYKSIKGDFDYINRFHAMNRGVLLYENDSEKILEYFGIEGSYSLLEGEIFYEETPSISPYDERLLENFYNKYSIGSIIKYYVTHPSAFKKVLDMGFSKAYEIRPEAMGNFEKMEGKEFGAKSNFFVLWSTLKKFIMPKGLLFAILYSGVYFVYSFKRYKKALNNLDNKSILIEDCFIYVYLAGLSQIFISVIGAGDADLSKHEFLFNLSFDLILINFIVQMIKNRGKEVNKG
ncbi:hypothetical protein [Clostridium sp.]|uniref:glycan biosynthesis hexose transferase WsfD n=1 Tax=Clostridium sp. TaxID=1506 RepID=UPI001D86E26E|nr:hypothetical protein [Clostridium sp.]MBS5985136.1 hypothetical protein [Clostridium sp.]